MVGLQIASILTLFLICNAGIVRQPCGYNSELLKNGSICRPFCDQDPNELELQYCKSKLISGCFCVPGYIRPYVDSIHCVPEEDCDHLPKCRVNQTYKECANLIPRNCGDLAPRVFIGTCHGGCDCKDGYVRIFNSQESNCVLEAECELYARNEYIYMY